MQIAAIRHKCLDVPHELHLQSHCKQLQMLNQVIIWSDCDGSLPVGLVKRRHPPFTPHFDNLCS